LSYGYLQSNQYVHVVATPGAIQILPLDPGLVYVPYYNPVVVFARPRPGFFIGGAIRFGPGITVGASFAPFGWTNSYLDWRGHAIVINNRPWLRNFANRNQYVHPYEWRRPVAPRVERHDGHDRR
jgi:hypothetical protein